MPRRGDRSPVTLECTECATRGYATSKNRRNNPDRLELNRYCRKCRKHTQHRETR